jgi:hypothetical protein
MWSDEKSNNQKQDQKVIWIFRKEREEEKTTEGFIDE